MQYQEKKLTIEQRLKEKLKSQQYNNLLNKIQSCAQSQEEALWQMLYILEETPKHVCLQGAAGSGKSYLAGILKDILVALYPNSVYAAASTHQGTIMPLPVIAVTGGEPAGIGTDILRIERIEVEDIDRRAMHFSFLPAITSGAYPVIIEGLSKSYGTHTVFEGVNMTIERGEKVAFVGKNGSGKSTLIKCIMGEVTDYTGSLRLGHNVEVGYFAQTQSQELDGNLTVYETIDREAHGPIRTKINDLLGAFMFGGEESEKKISVLSGGERGRVALIKLLLRPANLLILDEPTNHLDIRSKEVLKEAITRFTGTVIVVSHDREFLDGLVSRVYEFRSGRVTEHIGGIYDWLQKRDREDNTFPSSLSELSPSAKATTSAPISSGAEDYQRQKEQAKERRALEKEIKATEERSEAIDTELRMLETQLSDPQHATDATLFSRYQALQSEQESLLARWEELAMKLDL